jgi:diacylglycerol kinase family enzyme
MLVIVNPYATGVSDRLRGRVMSALERRYRVDAVETAAPGHAVELAREAPRHGFDAVGALGGDGTVNEVANGLADARGAGSPSALACLPAGQANVFAKMLGMPAEALGASAHLLSLADRWQPRKVDLGVVNGRCFTFSSGVGVDASVTRQVDSNPHLKARFGPWYYTWAVIATFARRYLMGAPRMTVGVAAGMLAVDASEMGPKAHERSCGGDQRAPERDATRALEGITTVVQNGTPFTFFRSRPIEIAEGGSLDSGELAGCVLRDARPLDMPFLAFRAVSARARMSTHRRVSSFSGVSRYKWTVTTSARSRRPATRSSLAP